MAYPRIPTVKYNTEAALKPYTTELSSLLSVGSYIPLNTGNKLNYQLNAKITVGNDAIAFLNLKLSGIKNVKPNYKYLLPSAI